MKKRPTDKQEGTKTYKLCTALGWNAPDKNISWPGPYTLEESWARAKQLDSYLSGTRPNGDVAYIVDSTTNDISDFAHNTLTLLGTIPAISHITYARKDDAGIRQIAQTCLSGTASELSQTISLGNSYVYYTDVIVNDPNTGSPFTTAGFNAITTGVKEIT
jgi:hypothetical protein